MRPLPSGPKLVKDLDPELPLLLLPVRLATRFHRGNGPGARPTELWLRIFPDSLHADGHAPALTRQEVALGQAYWERLWRVAGNAGAREDSQRWLVRQLGAPRAAWVIAQTAPANPGDAPAAPVPRSRPLDPAPVWPEPAGAEPPRPTLARLLPDRWHVTISATGEISEEVWSDPVRRDLAMAPNVADIPEDGAIRELFESQDLWWMADFEAAVDAGMAMHIPLNMETSRLISSLVVFGVRDRDPGAEEELAGLLDAHRFTSGLEIVTHGTPTNSTATVDAGFTDVPQDLNAYISRQLSAPEAERPQLEDPASLGTAGAADALALAFGLDGTTAFDVAEHAGDRTGARAEAMNRVLWPATWGYFLNTLLATGGTPVLAGADLDWLRSWFADWVRGPGLLPAFRAGEQPYGVLPVGDLPWWEPEPPSTRIAHLKSVVGGLRGDWLTSSGEVPGFWATLTRTPEEEAVAVASVLGAVPHPTAFRLRRALGRYERFADQWQDALTELESRVDETNDNLIRQYEAREADIRGGAIDVQSSQLAAVIDDANAQEDATSSLPAEFEAVRDQVDVLWADVNRHRARSETRFWSDSFSDATLPDPDDPSLWYVEYGDDGAAADGTFPDLKLVPGGGAEDDPVQLAASLRGLAADARSVTSTERPEYDHTAPTSLLRVLIEHGIEQVHHSKAVEIAIGLDRLADMCEAGAVDDPVAELEGLLRETLGLATHRLDAWVSSVAAHRLAELRAERPTGIQVGGYGWLVQLEPDSAGADTHGFVHAPSLAHASTAAVLRSAWLAFADGSTDAAFAVNLSSDRVRRAEWLLEGVRNGVDLAELLGARFERRLHDEALDQLVADVREAVLIEAGHPDLPATGIVDGLALATAYRDEDEPSDLRDRIRALRATLPDYPDDALYRTLLETVADLDSTADALMAQSVHSLVKGNLAEASAALAASGSGDAGLPELRMARVHRESQNVSHRVTAVFGGASPGGSSLLALAEPALAAWLESLLSGLDPAPLDGLGLGAAEIVALASGDGALDGSRLAAIVLGLARLAGAPSGARVDAAPGDSVSLSELAVVAGALRSAIGQSRALRGEDLAQAADKEPRLDIDELRSRLDAVSERLDQLAGAAPNDSTLRSRVADLVAVNDAGTIAALEAAPDERPALIAAVLRRAAERASALAAPLPAEWDDWSPGARAEHLCRRIGRALALKLPILPRFQPSNGADLVASAALSERRLGSPLAAATWLLQAGRVHAGTGRVDEALGLTAALRGEAVTAEQVVQVPHHPEDPWVATARPASRGGRTCVLSLTDLAGAVEEGPVSGLLFDAWTEPLPGPTATTGVAVHLDSPGAQPPQAVLLATVARDRSWTVDGLNDILSQTLELALMRTVGPEHLMPWGHSLPAVFLPDGVAVSTLEDDAGEAAE